jgi:hypothetical protein
MTDVIVNYGFGLKREDKMGIVVIREVGEAKTKNSEIGPVNHPWRWSPPAQWRWS